MPETSVTAYTCDISTHVGRWPYAKIELYFDK